MSAKSPAAVLARSMSHPNSCGSVGPVGCFPWSLGSRRSLWTSWPWSPCGPWGPESSRTLVLNGQLALESLWSNWPWNPCGPTAPRSLWTVGPGDPCGPGGQVETTHIRAPQLARRSVHQRAWFGAAGLIAMLRNIPYELPGRQYGSCWSAATPLLPISILSPVVRRLRRLRQCDVAIAGSVVESAAWPMAVLLLPVVLSKSAISPRALLPFTLNRAISDHRVRVTAYIVNQRERSNGCVKAACCVTEEHPRANGRIFIRVVKQERSSANSCAEVSVRLGQGRVKAKCRAIYTGSKEKKGTLPIRRVAYGRSTYWIWIERWIDCSGLR